MTFPTTDEARLTSVLLYVLNCTDISNKKAAIHPGCLLLAVCDTVAPFPPLQHFGSTLIREEAASRDLEADRPNKLVLLATDSGLETHTCGYNGSCRYVHSRPLSTLSTTREMILERELFIFIVGLRSDRKHQSTEGNLGPLTQRPLPELPRRPLAVHAATRSPTSDSWDAKGRAVADRRLQVLK